MVVVWVFFVSNDFCLKNFFFFLVVIVLVFLWVLVIFGCGFLIWSLVNNFSIFIYFWKFFLIVVCKVVFLLFLFFRVKLNFFLFLLFLLVNYMFINESFFCGVFLFLLLKRINILFLIIYYFCKCVVLNLFCLILVRYL